MRFPMALLRPVLPKTARFGPLCCISVARRAGANVAASHQQGETEPSRSKTIAPRQPRCTPRSPPTTTLS